MKFKQTKQNKKVELIRGDRSYIYNIKSKITFIKNTLMQIYVQNKIWDTPPLSWLMVGFSKRIILLIILC